MLLRGDHVHVLRKELVERVHGFLAWIRLRFFLLHRFFALNVLDEGATAPRACRLAALTPGCVCHNLTHVTEYWLGRFWRVRPSRSAISARIRHGRPIKRFPSKLLSTHSADFTLPHLFTFLCHTRMLPPVKDHSHDPQQELTGLAKTWPSLICNDPRVSVSSCIAPCHADGEASPAVHVTETHTCIRCESR